jgi:hypothetical protein
MVWISITVATPPEPGNAETETILFRPPVWADTAAGSMITRTRAATKATIEVLRMGSSGKRFRFPLLFNKTRRKLYSIRIYGAQFFS